MVQCFSNSLSLFCPRVYDEWERDREGYLDVLSNDRRKCEVLFIFKKLQSLYEREKEEKIAKHL